MVRIVIDPAFAIGEVDERLFGSFVEHMGRAVYGGIYEPGHERADEQGLRTDVLELVRELGVTLVRYPGGNFVSGYDWEDGVGPDRPTRLDLAWRAIEPNAVGTDEFMGWAAKANVLPMLAVNLGTRGVDAARNLVEYCNAARGTSYADRRPRAEPYAVRTWCLGNEMDGPWQIGHRSAEEYAALALAAGTAMRRVDPAIELVLAGSSGPHMPTFGAWDDTVLDRAFDIADYISLHRYYDPDDYETEAEYLACAHDFDRTISAIRATADAVSARRRSDRRIALAVDEWNVWHQRENPHFTGAEPVHAPAIAEDAYSVLDALVVGTLLITLLRHADRVKIACLAQLVNVIAPIRTEPGGPAWRQTIFHPFAHAARHGRGTVLRVEHDEPALEATAVLGERLTFFAVNRSTEPLAVELVVRDLPLGELEHIVMDSPTPRRIAPNLELLPRSWNVIRI